MPETIRITASQRIEAPADAVRQQYRDIDHHIRNNVHPSIRYTWEPAAPGERKIRTTFRILGVPQYDVSLLEDAEDGSFVIRYLEGSNAGMVLVHEFVPLEPGATDVQLTADAPASLARKLLGPLFVAGARQVMKKALMEDKRDLERGAFVAGTAAGNVEGALESLRPLVTQSQTAKRAVLDAACLISAADGDVDAAERDALERLARFVRAEDATRFMGERLEVLAAMAATDQIAEEAERVGAALSKERVAEHGIVAAAVVGLVSHGMSLGELEALRRVATAASFAEESLGAIVNTADEALSKKS